MNVVQRIHYSEKRTFIEAALDEYQKLTTQQLSYYRNQEEQL